jgi:hypothetical protein
MRKLALILLLVFLGTSAYSVSDSKIGAWLKKHEEEGYKFLKEIDSTTWQMQFKMKDWKYNWNVYAQISKNESYPDFNIVYVFTTVATLKAKPSASLMAYILKKNEDTANWGSYTIQEYKDGDWEIHYMVKLRQSSLDSEGLINAVGFVAGYANSVFADIEDYDK